MVSFLSVVLLPLREKVSPRATDEGSRRRRRSNEGSIRNAVDPSSDPLRGPPSPARGEGS
ncbi:MAG TPA: hypothetical protein VII63_05400 [Caulobacteraceae bacterium]